MTKNHSKMLILHFIAGISFSGLALSQAALAQAGDAQPAPLTGLVPQHITISVENLDVEAAWYQRVLGFKVVQRLDTNPDFMLEQLSIPGYRVDMIKYKGSARPATPNPLYLQQGWIHAAYSVPDLAAALKQLQALKTDVTVAMKDEKGIPTGLRIHDPEGNELEFFTRE